MDKSSFILYTDYFEQIQMLTIEQRGTLLTACMLYQLGEDLPEMDAVTRMCFLFISADMRRNNEKYERIVEQRAEAGRKGGKQTQANKANATFASNAENANQAKQANQANASDNDNENVNDNETDKENDTKDVAKTDNEPSGSSSAGQSGSEPPSFKDVCDEVHDQGYTVSAMKFFEYYQKNGWKTTEGEPIRNWRTMLKVWDMKERKESPAAAVSAPKKKTKNAFNNFEQRDYSEEELEAQLLELGV